MARTCILPGITGWAQTRYRYANNLEQETEKMRYDFYYIRHMSLWMDFRILLATGVKILSSFRAVQGESQFVAEPSVQSERERAQAAWQPDRPAPAQLLPVVQYGCDAPAAVLPTFRRGRDSEDRLAVEARPN